MRFTWARGLAGAICCQTLALAGCGGGSPARGDSGTGGTGGVWQYTNRVIKGDWSDPGVVRVGEDYYSVRSTFGWQPGLAVAHSKDRSLARYIGNGFSSLPSIATGEVAGGIWGSEISADNGRVKGTPACRNWRYSTPRRPKNRLASPVVQ
jgi:Glycosyl hydrolases family 43